MDPISWHEATNLDVALTVYEGDRKNGIKIYFENEEDRQKYLDLGKNHRIVLQGNDADEYVAEG